MTFRPLRGQPSWGQPAAKASSFQHTGSARTDGKDQVGTYSSVSKRISDCKISTPGTHITHLLRQCGRQEMNTSCLQHAGQRKRVPSSW